jgi:hypothetical protein
MVIIIIIIIIISYGCWGVSLMMTTGMEVKVMVMIMMIIITGHTTTGHPPQAGGRA